LNETALTNPTDVLVWPESAVPEMSAENCRAISAVARTHHVWLILNGEDMSTSHTETNWFNAAFLVNPQGELTATYHKQKLVIFGEYVPLARWLPFLKWFTPIEGGWTAGDRPVAFCGTNFSGEPLICFEDCFPATARNAATNAPDFLVNLTNDGWFGDSAEQWQHLANSVFRAVETGRPLVRCANNGITGWVDEHGRLQQIFRSANGSEYGAGAISMKIPLRPAGDRLAMTFYQRHGDGFAWGCVAIALGSLVARWKSIRRRG
jgi:apolipoprotein N-acyltransferase